MAETIKKRDDLTDDEKRFSDECKASSYKILQAINEAYPDDDDARQIERYVNILGGSMMEVIWTFRAVPDRNAALSAGRGFKAFINQATNGPMPDEAKGGGH